MSTIFFHAIEEIDFVASLLAEESPVRGSFFFATRPTVSYFFLAIGNFGFFILLIVYIVVLFRLNPLHSKCLVITLNEQLTVV